MVAGSVAAADAYLKQRDLQTLCDGAALAGAADTDSDAGRHLDTDGAGPFLPLDHAKAAVDAYLARDPDRTALSVEVTVVPSSILPSRVMAPALNRSCVTSIVFPVSLWPTTATFRISEPE